MNVHKALFLWSFTSERKTQPWGCRQWTVPRCCLLPSVLTSLLADRFCPLSCPGALVPARPDRGRMWRTPWGARFCHSKIRYGSEANTFLQHCAVWRLHAFQRFLSLVFQWAVTSFSHLVWKGRVNTQLVPWNGSCGSSVLRVVSVRSRRLIPAP